MIDVELVVEVDFVSVVLVAAMRTNLPDDLRGRAGADFDSEGSVA